MKSIIVVTTFCLSITLPPTLASAEELYMRVVDVGAGHCAIIKMPDNHYLIYDAGHWKPKGKYCFEAIKELIPAGSNIDLMVLSHTDSDHLGAVLKIVDRYKILRTIRPGIKRTTKTWKRANTALLKEAKDHGMVDIQLKHGAMPGGAIYRFGKTTVTLVLGYATPPAKWGQLSESEKRNAGSIIIRVKYQNKSILLTGDSVGRHIGDPDDACIAAEKEAVDRSDLVPIASNVLVAPHHGADNGSSKCLIKAVAPEYVIFPAGHEYEHPRKTTAERYKAVGLDLSNIYRTDLGDDEGSKEWAKGRITNHKDKPGKNDIEVTFPEIGPIKIGYRVIP